MTGNAFTAEEMNGMEFKILDTLDYILQVPTAYHFLIRYLDVMQSSPEIRALSSYYADRNLLEYDLVKHPSYKFAAACVYTARVQQAQHNKVHYPCCVWPQMLEEESGLKESDLTSISRVLVMHVREECQAVSIEKRQLSIRRKYSDKALLGVYNFPLPSI